jgi:hypothetical protein
MNKTIVAKGFMMAWTKGWKVQPEARFRIGLTIYVSVIKLGYLTIAKKSK